MTKIQANKTEEFSHINITILKLFVVWLYTEEQEITLLKLKASISVKKTPNNQTPENH